MYLIIKFGDLVIKSILSSFLLYNLFMLFDDYANFHSSYILFFQIISLHCYEKIITELRFESTPAVISRPESPKDEDGSATDPLDHRQIELHAEEEDLERQQACLHAWNSLQNDLQQLHQLFVDFNQIIQVI